MKTTTLKRKALSILLALVMLFGMMPMTALAAGTVPTIYVGGVQLGVGYHIKNGATAATSGAPEADDTGYVYLYEDAANSGALTMELNSAVFNGPTTGNGAAIYIADDSTADTELTVKLVGESKLTGSAVEGSDSAGIFCAYVATQDAPQCDLIFTGSGTLYATGVATGSEASSYGITGNKSITVESGTVIATGGTVKDENPVSDTKTGSSYGIRAADGITISGGYIKAIGGDGTRVTGADAPNSMGIITAGGNIVMTGGEVYAQSGTVPGTSLAMQCGVIPAGTITTPTSGYDVKAGDSAESAAAPSEALNTYKYVSVVPVSRPGITVTTPTNGTVTATVAGADATAAVPGAGVKLTATPASGYVLDTFTVTDKSSNPIPVDSGGCFTMPATAVTVLATFSGIAVTGVSLNETALTLTVKDTATLTATVSPTDAANKNVTWKSSDTTVATVNSGAITALKPGNATITVTTEDGSFTATCAVTVKAIEITGNVSIVGTVKYGETLTANYVKGADGETVAYQWYRGDTAIDGATEATYILTAEDVGKTIKVVLTGTGDYGGEKSATTATAVEALTFADGAITAQGYAGEYDGTAHGITVTAPAGAAVKYGTTEGTYDLTESPTLTDAGTLTMYYQVTQAGYEPVTGSAAVAITKATPSYTVPADLTATYGQTLADVELPAGFTWQDAITTPVGNTGTKTFKVTYTPADTDNYNTVTDIEVAVKVIFAVEAICDGDSWGTVKVERSGDQVKLTATPAEGIKFEYWLDTSATMRSTLTEAQLKAAIVSYDATYTFTATKNVSLEAVFSISGGIGITPMLIAGTDEKSLSEAEWMDVEYDFGTITPGDEPIALPGEVIDEIITIGDKQYRFAGFIFHNYDEATETETVELKETLTIGAMPLYNSAEYWDWYASFSDGLFTAYMEYTPDDPKDPENPDEPQNPDKPQDPDKPQNPDKPKDPDKSQKPNSNSPQTDDNSHMALWFALLFISGGAVTTLTVYGRQRGKAADSK